MMKRSNELQVEEYFRKRIEKRLLDWRFRISIPESFRLFVPHEKSEAFCGKDNPDDLIVAISQGIENSLSLQLVAASF